MVEKPGNLLLIIGVLVPIIYFILIQWGIFYFHSPDHMEDNSVFVVIHSVLSSFLIYVIALLPDSYENLPIILYASLIACIGISNLSLWMVLRRENNALIINTYRIPLRFLCGLSIGFGIVCALLQLLSIPVLFFAFVFGSILSGSAQDTMMSTQASDITLGFFLIPFLILFASIILSRKIHTIEAKRRDTYFWIGMFVAFIFIGIISVYLMVVLPSSYKNLP